MLLTTLLFVVVTAVVRYIGDAIPASQAAFIRYVIGTIILLPFIIPLIKKSITRKDLIIYVFRGLAHGFGVIMWFYAMSRIPIAEVTAISYTGPIYISIGAAIFFGEKLALRRILAIIIAFIGTLIILPITYLIKAACDAGIATPIYLTTAVTITKSNLVNNIHKMP